ncbi:transmembrane protein, putative (macronuclear) [Tetrahymena thermophila SB210]|uniref:Transmembrane protein, putative n=1 Tax=Tetrahymena thermophila (strain SB210) TaxID=312017 RepID=W7X0X6_TETTS|nr:transmembrane protein, putative [Tetrahymena thermophila SB210]EWS72795.1 transmembrane protein, putative [Tetrahymena thermophila SB210]|eukprot:XP_012654682.1 transmembrane protein, putative [Tetrahymena thermophila SB210]
MARLEQGKQQTSSHDWNLSFIKMLPKLNNFVKNYLLQKMIKQINISNKLSQQQIKSCNNMIKLRKINNNSQQTNKQIHSYYQKTNNKQINKQIYFYFYYQLTSNSLTLTILKSGIFAMTINYHCYFQLLNYSYKTVKQVQFLILNCQLSYILFRIQFIDSYIHILLFFITKFYCCKLYFYIIINIFETNQQNMNMLMIDQKDMGFSFHLILFQMNQSINQTNKFISFGILLNRQCLEWKKFTSQNGEISVFQIKFKLKLSFIKNLIALFSNKVNGCQAAPTRNCIKSLTMKMNFLLMIKITSKLKISLLRVTFE